MSDDIFHGLEGAHGTGNAAIRAVTTTPEPLITVSINPHHFFHFAVCAVTTAALTAVSSAAISRTSLGAVAMSSGPLTSPTVVDFGSLSGDATYEFSFNAVKGGASTAIAGNAAFAIKLDQWNETGTFGTTQFGVADNFFTAIAGKSVDSIFQADLHVAIVNDSVASEVKLYLNGEQTGSLSGSLELMDTVTVMGARDPVIDPMGDGSVMYGWATYDSALSDLDIGELAVTDFEAIPEPSTSVLFLLGGLALGFRHRRRVAA